MSSYDHILSFIRSCNVGYEIQNTRPQCETVVDSWHPPVI